MGLTGLKSECLQRSSQAGLAQRGEAACISWPVACSTPPLLALFFPEAKMAVQSGHVPRSCPLPALP